jgi:perosamine synthetase
MIPISRPLIDERAEKLVLEVLRSGQLARGEMTVELERRFRDLSGCAEAVAVSSGTAALELTMESVIRPGDVVVTTPFTFVATINAALRSGAVVRFVDIGNDFNLDPELLAAAVDDRVQVILPVHLYGRPADMTAVTSVARESGATIIEDAAQAIGAEWDGKAVGSWGFGCFSLYATKNVTSGEGGVITTNDVEVGEQLRVLSNQGMSSQYEYVTAGTNRRMTELQAAIALPQVDDLSHLIAARRRNAHRLTMLLEDISGLRTPEDHPGHVYHQYTVRVTPEAAITRDQLQKHLVSAGVASGVYYPRVVFNYDIFRSHPRVEISPVPKAETAASEVLSLPVHPSLTESDLDRIGLATREAFSA